MNEQKTYNPPFDSIISKIAKFVFHASVSYTEMQSFVDFFSNKYVQTSMF